MFNNCNVIYQYLELNKQSNYATLIFFSGKPVTKLLYTYSCTNCDLEDDQVKDSVEAALQSMNLTQYHGKTNTDKHPVKTSKVLQF